MIRTYHITLIRTRGNTNTREIQIVHKIPTQRGPIDIRDVGNSHRLGPFLQIGSQSRVHDLFLIRMIRIRNTRLVIVDTTLCTLIVLSVDELNRISFLQRDKGEHQPKDPPREEKNATSEIHTLSLVIVHLTHLVVFLNRWISLMNAFVTAKVASSAAVVRLCS